MRAIVSTLLFGVAILVAGGVAADEAPGPARSEPTSYSLPPEIAREAGTLLSSLRRHDLGAAEISLFRLRDLRIEAGIPNLSPVSAAFRGLFDEASAEAPPGLAIRIASTAISLAPDDPGLRWLLARTQMRTGIEGIGSAAAAALDAVHAYQRNPRALTILAANASAYLLGALILVLVLGGLAFLARHGRLLAHDLGDLFPSAPATPFSAVEMAQSRKLQAIVGSGLTRMLAISLVGLLLLLPFVLGFGLVPSVVLWTLLILPYLRRSEAVAAAMGFVLVASLPLLGALVLLPDRAAATDGPRMWTALEEAAGEEFLPLLARRSIDHPSEPWAPTILARQEVRRSPLSPGPLAAAATRLEPFAGEPSGVVATDLANVLLRRTLASCRDGKPAPALAAEAREAYQRALHLAPGSPAVLRGMALTAGLAGDRDGLEKALQSLVTVTPDADLESIARLRTLSPPAAACASPGLVAAELRPPDSPDWDIYLADVDPFAMPTTLPMNAWVLGRTPVAWLPILGVGGLALLLVIAMFHTRLPFASACPRCGTVSCRSCNHEASGFDYCPTCLFEQVKPAFLDPLDVVAMQRRREERHDWARVALPTLSLALPGVGQLLAGRPIRGALLLLVLFLSVGAVLFPTPPVIDTEAFAGGLGAGLPVWPPVALAVVYLISALDTWVNRTS